MESGGLSRMTTTCVPANWRHRGCTCRIKISLWPQRKKAGEICICAHICHAHSGLSSLSTRMVKWALNGHTKRPLNASRRRGKGFRLGLRTCQMAHIVARVGYWIRRRNWPSWLLGSAEDQGASYSESEGQESLR